jgi:hypothetical protein
MSNGEGSSISQRRDFRPIVDLHLDVIADRLTVLGGGSLEVSCQHTLQELVLEE